MEITINDFFFNIKNIPPQETEEFDALIDSEIKKCMGGVTIDGVYFSGFLYWHLAHWWIRDDEEDAFGNIVRRKLQPSLRDNEWIVAEYLEICRVEKKGYLHIGARQFGKDLLNSSKLYSKDKEITIGDCSIGDKIYDESGKLTTIIGKYPQGKKPVYKMTLIDGRELFCGLEHNWYVYDRLSKKYLKKTTGELIPNYKKERLDWKTRKSPYEFRYSIPNNDPVQYEEKDLPIDPYVLGLWLGDGSNTYSKITSVDEEIISYLYKYAESVGLQITIDDEDTFMLTSGKMGKGDNDRNFIHSYLKSKGLYNNKHIPSDYFYSSIEQRMELLRGLMDSDGSVGKRGQIEFFASHNPLANDFYNLCRSLGINLSRKVVPTHYKKDGETIKCKDSNRFTLYTDKPVFRLSRKVERMTAVPKYKDHTAIVDIQYVYDADTTCITVDNESHLFLTDNYTVTHNSEIMASYLAYHATLFEHTQNVIVGGNDDDLQLLRDKIDFGIKSLWVGLQIPKLDKDTKKNMTRLGFKSKQGNEDQVWSYLIVRNVAEGNKTEGPAGVTAKAYATDEIGKFSFAQSFEAAKPAFKSKFGWRCVPLLFGTGGSFTNGADAERFFFHPEANNFLAVTDPETGKKTGIFMSGLYRIDCKYNATLADYLIQEGKLAPDAPQENLRKIPMAISDKVKAKELILQERKDKAKDPDRTEYLKLIMYYPLTVDECFLSSAKNFYNGELAKMQKQKLEENEIKPMSVELYHDGTKIVHKETPDRVPISSFPTKDTEDLDAPISIWEHPIPDPPYGLYVAGVDSYIFDESDNSDSLGSVYIFKRIHDIMGETYQDCFVASYVARPKEKTKWKKQAELLVRYYNAQTLVENDEMSFIDHMITEGFGHLLTDTPDWLTEEQGMKPSKRPKGISRQSDKIRRRLRGILKEYLEEKLTEIKDEVGNIISTKLGISQVYDTMLLAEIMLWNEDGNFDREIAASLAVAQARALDRAGITVDSREEDSRYKSLNSKAPKKALFGKAPQSLTKRKVRSNLFK